MRRLFWCGVALALVGGVGGYWLAAGEVCCPGRLIAQCVQYLFGKAHPRAAIVAQQNRNVDEVALVPLGGFDANGLPILEPDPNPPCRALELIDLPLLTANPPIKIQEEEEMRVTGVGAGLGIGGGIACDEFIMCGLSADPVPKTSQPDGSETSEEPQDLAQIMLPCLEDDLPDFMPYAEDTQATDASFFEFLMGMFHSPAPMISGATEEAETVPATKPECREDPNHPFQDAGCPFMGPCPAGRGRCPDPIHVAPKMEPEPQESRLDVDVFRLLHRRLPCMLEPGNVEEGSVHREVDTMEFRPSDATMKAFENWQKRLPL
jgi:hypothetical protein